MDLHQADDDDDDRHHKEFKQKENNDNDENAPYRALDEDVRDFWVPREVPRLKHPITALTFLRVRKGDGRRNERRTERSEGMKAWRGAEIE